MSNNQTSPLSNISVIITFIWMSIFSFTHLRDCRLFKSHSDELKESYDNIHKGYSNSDYSDTHSSFSTSMTTLPSKMPRDTAYERAINESARAVAGINMDLEKELSRSERYIELFMKPKLTKSEEKEFEQLDKEITAKRPNYLIRRLMPPQKNKSSFTPMDTLETNTPKQVVKDSVSQKDSLK